MEDLDFLKDLSVAEDDSTIEYNPLDFLSELTTSEDGELDEDNKAEFDFFDQGDEFEKIRQKSSEENLEFHLETVFMKKGYSKESVKEYVGDIVEEFASKTEALSSELAQITNEKQAITKERDVLSVQLEETTDEICSLKQMADLADEYNNENGELNKVLSDTQNQISEHTAANDEFFSKIKSLNHDLEIANQQKVEILNEKNALEVKVSEGQALLTDSNATNKELEIKVSKLVEELRIKDEKICSLESNIESLKETIVSLREERTTFQTELIGLDDNLSYLNNKLADLENVDSLNSQLKEEVESLKVLCDRDITETEEYEELNSTVEGFKNLVDELQTEKSVLTQENADLHSSLSELEIIIKQNDSDVSQYIDKIEGLKQSNLELTNRSQSLTSRLEETVELLESFKAKTLELENANSHNAELIELNEKLENELVASNQGKCELDLRMDALVSRLNASEKNLAESLEANEGLTVENDRLNSRLAHSLESLKGFESIITKVNVLNEDNAKLSAMLSEADSENAALKAANKNMDETYLELSSRLDKVEEEKASLQDENKSLMKQLDDSLKVLKQLRITAGNNLDLSAENNRLAAVNSNLTNELQVKSNIIKRLEAQAEADRDKICKLASGKVTEAKQAEYIPVHYVKPTEHAEVEDDLDVSVEDEITLMMRQIKKELEQYRDSPNVENDRDKTVVINLNDLYGRSSK